MGIFKDSGCRSCYQEIIQSIINVCIESVESMDLNSRTYKSTHKPHNDKQYRGQLHELWGIEAEL